MKQAEINIIGQIGRIPGEAAEGTITLLEIVPKVRMAIDAGAEALLVGILSPGGYVDEGNAIYDYLMSLKKDRVENGKTVKGLTINTTTIPDPITGKGLVGSIATKPFLAGEERTVYPEDDFFIHNPWMNPGPSDSKQLLDSAAAALKAEEELKAFYCAVTKNTPEALAPFMDAETSLTGTEAVKFGFATKLKNRIRLLAMIKPKTV